MEEFDPLIRGCLRNDRKSQEGLYRKLYVPLFLACRRLFSHDHEAIESVNDGMLKVFENISSFQPEKGKFFNWVYTIVRNAALDKIRSAVMQNTRTDALTATGDTAEADESYNPLSSLEEKDLYMLLDRLPPATRAISTLFYVEGYSVREIATRLAIQTGTVKWHLSDGRKKLKPIAERLLNE